MIEGYYVEATEDSIDLVVVHGFPEASACLIFVPVFSILTSFNDVLYFLNAFVGRLVGSECFLNLLGDPSPRFP